MKKLFFATAAISLTLLLNSCGKIDPLTDQINHQIGGATGNPNLKDISVFLSSDPNYSLYYRMVQRAGLTSRYFGATNNLSYMIVVADNDAMKNFIFTESAGAVPLNSALSVFDSYITNTLPVLRATNIVNYNTAAVGTLRITGGLLTQSITTFYTPKRMTVTCNTDYPSNIGAYFIDNIAVKNLIYNETTNIANGTVYVTDKLLVY